jgi:DNA-binding NarL/FixJ family response regulator
LAFYESLRRSGKRQTGIEKVKQLRPDLVLLDTNMPVMNGVQAAYEIRRIAPSTTIVFFTIHDSPETMSAARLIGADGFVPKAAAGTQLIPEMKRILEPRVEFFSGPDDSGRAFRLL